MIRALATITGLVAAGTTAVGEIATGASPTVALGWSVIAGIAGAGMTYGITSNKVAAAHQRIDAEKDDREKAVSDLKLDVNRGFDRIEKQLSDQTRTVIDALSRREG